MCDFCDEPVTPDASTLYKNGVCVICAQPRTPGGEWNHAVIHLARGEAFCESQGGETRVLPMGGNVAPLTVPSGFFKARDPLLRKLANAALKRAQRKP